jgi:hypothetical protein
MTCARARCSRGVLDGSVYCRAGDAIRIAPKRLAPIVAGAVAEWSNG